MKLRQTVEEVVKEEATQKEVLSQKKQIKILQEIKESIENIYEDEYIVDDGGYDPDEEMEVIDELENLSYDVGVPSVSSSVSFYVIGKESPHVVYIGSSEHGRKNAERLREALVGKTLISQSDIEDAVKGILKDIGGSGSKGQRWAKGYAYFHPAGVFVPVSYMLGGRGKMKEGRRKKVIDERWEKYRHVVEEVIRQLGEGGSLRATQKEHVIKALKYEVKDDKDNVYEYLQAKLESMDREEWCLLINGILGKEVCQ